MTISSTNWIVRFAYLFKGWTPSHTTLCGLFWRCVGSLIIVSLLGAVAAGVLVLVFTEFVTVLAFLLAVGALIGFFAFADYAKNNLTAPEIVSTVKGKLCPTIVIERPVKKSKYADGY